VFLERYCDGASIDGLEYFNRDPVAQWELGHLYLDLLKSNSQQPLQNPPAQGIDFLQITLREIFARKRRAVQNLRKLENIIKGEDSGLSRSPLVELKQLSDDEICELALLMERYTWSVAIKWIFGEFLARLSDRSEVHYFLPPEAFARIGYVPANRKRHFDPEWGLSPGDGDHKKR
jgi:hypothetical protein